MKPLLLLFLALTFLGQHVALAQTANTAPNDDDFTAFLLLFGSVFLAVMAGVMLASAMVTGLLMLFIFTLVSAGVLSTAIMVGIYKRSVLAGFKTLVIIISAAGGAIIGIIGLYLVNRLLKFHLTQSTITWSGLIGGLAGGLLLGSILFFMLRLFLNYTKRKLSF